MSQVQKYLCILLLLMFQIVVCVEPSEAQVLYGSIVGSVTDPTGRSVPAASVAIRSEETSQGRQTSADGEGRFTVSNLLPGPYTITVTAPGFRPYSSTANMVRITSVTRADVKLSLGEVAESVTVSADMAGLQTEKTDVQVNIGAKEITEMPLPKYRNYQSLLDLVPGATPTEEQNAIIDTPARSLTTNVNGTVRYTNTTRVDGAVNLIIYLPHHTAYVPPAETIESVSVSTNTFDAEQGLAGGAAITVNTKSGTNELHGAAFAYHTNSRLRARNFFYQGKNPKNIVNMDGVVVGGPIIKNKLFFFGGWEGTRERVNYSSFYTVPTADIRGGDFSLYNVSVYDPLTGDANGRGRELFPNKTIPLNRQSPIAQRMQARVPLPNQARISNNLFNSGNQALDRDNFDVKGTWNRNAKNTIWAKYSAMNANVNCAFGLGDAGGAGLCSGGSGNGKTIVQLATLGSTYIVSPRLLVDQTFGFTRFWQEVKAPDYGKNVGLDLGIPGTNGPDIRQSGIPTFSISGFSAWGNTDTWMPAFRYDNTFTNMTNASWMRGAHELRFGFDLIRLQLNHWQPQIGGGPRGAFNFAGGVTALNGGPATNQYNAYASFLLGLPASMQKTVQFFAPMATREWQTGWYVRDRWQATRRLTLTLGLRYEYYPLMTRAWSGIERYDAETNKVLIGGLGNVPGNAGVEVSSKLFAPRVGFAYRLGSETVIRAGYGLSYDPMPLSRPFRGTYPVMISNDYLSANSYQPFRPLEQGIPELVEPNYRGGVVDLPLTATTITPPKGMLRRGYIQSWNFILERKLPLHIVATAGYVATKAVRQLSDLNINASTPGLGNTGRPLAIRFGRLVDTTLTDAFAGSNYHSLQATLNRRFQKGFFLKGAYTFGKAIDQNDEPSRGNLLFNDPSQLSRNRALAGFDRTHNLQLGFLYELPLGPGKPLLKERNLAGRIAGGWQVNGIFSAYSGRPFTVTAPGTSLNAPGNTQTADQVKSEVQILGGVGPGAPWFDTTAFAPVTQVRYGTSGRNILRGPGAVNLNVNLFRRFDLNERLNLQFRAEAFNVANHAQFNNPDASVNSGTFGIINSARPVERQIRFGLRLGF